MNFKKCLSVMLFLTTFVIFSNAQERSRIVKTTENQPTTTTNTTQSIKKTVISSPTINPATRPTLTNKIVVQQPQTTPQMVNKTSSSQSTTPTNNYSSSSRMAYGSALVSRMMTSIQSKYGIPYRLGTTGPNRYDCSGFVWSVFNDAGIYFARSSARTYWSQFEPVYGDDRYKFGTLVFLNRLGHVGIVADQNGFYHASQSKGITYSKFAGYWEKRIVGFRRVPVN
jgi:cell wall-associated NlpC family hydrolase